MNKKEFEEHQKKVEEIKGKEVFAGADIDIVPDFESEKEAESDIITVELGSKIKGDNKVVLDFTKINGVFLERCKQQYKNIKVVKKEVINIETLDDKFYVVVTSNLTGIPYMDIMELPYKDYKAILDEVRGFLN